MPEELDTELLDEKKFERMNKQKFNDNLESAIGFVKDTKTQFEEKYQILHEDLGNVTDKVKDIETKLGTVDDKLYTMDKSMGVFGTGIDYIKEDVKKFQVSQDSLEKMVQEKISALYGNIEIATREIKNAETKLSTVDNRLNAVDKSMGVFGTGIDYIKENVKKVQTSHSSLEKLVQEKIFALSGNVDTKLRIVDDRLDTIDKSIGIFCAGIDCTMEDVKKFKVSQDSLEKMVQEKISVLSGNIENVTNEVKDVVTKLGTVDNRLCAVDKSIEILHIGVDGVKEDVKKFQVSQDSLEKLVQEKYQTLYEDLEKSHDTLEKLVQEKFKELGEKVQGLEHPTFICENCGYQVIVPLSSYCPNCGSQIENWSDEDGQPAKGWIPYWKRQESLR